MLGSNEGIRRNEDSISETYYQISKSYENSNGYIYPIYFNAVEVLYHK